VVLSCKNLQNWIVEMSLRVSARIPRNVTYADICIEASKTDRCAEFVKRLCNAGLHGVKPNKAYFYLAALRQSGTGSIHLRSINCANEDENRYFPFLTRCSFSFIAYFTCC